MFGDFIKEYIEKYVDNEINYIKKEISLAETTDYRQDDLKELNKDLKYLEELTENDFNYLRDELLYNDDIETYIYERIHDVLYDYAIEKEEK